MIIPTRAPSPTRSRIDRVRPGEPDVAAFVLGVSIFLMIAAACLYFVARAGS